MDLSSKPALMVIDAQEGIKEEAHWGGNRNNRGADRNIGLLLDQWRKLRLPVIIVQHASVSPISPFRPNHSGYKLMDFVNLDISDKHIVKSTASAFVKTDLQKYIEEQGITALVITGFVTNNSVESTARNSGDIGIKTVVVSDATACFDKITMNGCQYSSDMVHKLALANLSEEYASIFDTKQILSMLS